MRQENSFFFQPLIYFGSYEQCEEEAEEEWNFSNLPPSFRQRIGLFIHWSENF